MFFKLSFISTEALNYTGMKFDSSSANDLIQQVIHNQSFYIYILFSLLNLTFIKNKMKERYLSFFIYFLSNYLYYN